jgi:hypothetical protein
MNGPSQDFENFPGISTVPLFLSNLPGSFPALIDLTERCGSAFRANFFVGQLIDFLGRFVPAFSVEIARLLLSLASQSFKLLPLCCQLVATCDLPTIYITFQILLELLPSSEMGDLVMPVLPYISDESLVAAGLKVLSNVSETCELDASFAPLFETIREFL